MVECWVHGMTKLLNTKIANIITYYSIILIFRCSMWKAAALQRTKDHGNSGLAGNECGTVDGRTDGRQNDHSGVFPHPKSRSHFSLS